MPNDQYEEEALPFATIGTDEAKKMIEAGARVIDVRQPDEWVRGHIPEAELVPINGIYSFGKALKDLKLPENEDVCHMVAASADDRLVMTARTGICIGSGDSVEVARED